MTKPYKNKPLSTIWTFLLTRFRVTLLFAFLFFTVGISSYQSMPQENTPDVEIPIVLISTLWPGATAEDVEALVTDILEQEIENIDDVVEYTSTSVAGFSSIAVEFEVGTDMTENTNNVRDAVDDATPSLPDSILDDPDVEKANISSTPILSLSVSGDYSYSQLNDYAESLSDALETIDGVKEARLSGVPDEQYHFYIDPIKLEGLGLGLDEVVNIIRAAHRDIPLGNISVRGESVEVRVAGEIETVAEFMTLPLITSSGQTIRLEDIGEVRREFDELEVETLISTGEAAARYISIDVLKAETKTNVPRVVETSLQTIDEFYASGQLPANMKIDIVFNSAEDIEKSLGQLFESGFQTLLVIGIVLLVALGWRESILAFVAIPLTLLIAITGLFLIGQTFNFLSLFALVLALGLLVDNAIIITEGISDGIYKKKLSPVDAARDTLFNYRWPVITGTTTTIFAFLPMLFLITGTSGEFIDPIPTTVLLVLLASLFVSLFMLPVFGAMFFSVFKPQYHRQSTAMNWLKKKYRELMNFLLVSRWRIYGLLLGSFGLMVFSFSLLATGRVSVEVFPSGDSNYFTVLLEAPSGTDKETMREYVPLLDEVFLPYFESQDQWLKNVQISVGQRSPFDPNADGRGGGGTAGENLIGVTVNLFDSSERETTSMAAADLVAADLEETLPDFLEVTVSELASGPPGGDQPVTIKIVSDDLNRIDEMVEILIPQLEAIELENGARLRDVKDNQGDQVPQMSWKFDREKLGRYGLSPSQLQQTLRAGVQGITILEITENGEEIDVEARFDFDGDRVWKSPESLDILSQIPIKTPSGDSIILEDVADFTIQLQRTQFRHEDGKRSVSVGAAIDGQATAAQFVPDLNRIIAELPTQPGDSVTLGGDNEETNRLVSEMLSAMLLAVFLILLILVLQFDSFLQAGVIIMLLPLSLMAVFIGFWLSGTPIGFPTMIGILALAGIIVNDSIVLIDKINREKREHDELYEDHSDEKNKRLAYIEAGVARMQPIILTSVTTIFGLLPLALSDPIWEGLAFAIIYGMTLATFLTVVLVPCLLVMYEDITWGVARTVSWPFRMVKRLMTQNG